MTRRELVLTHASLLVVAVVWGATFVSIRFLLRTLSPTSTLLLRVELASICFAAMLVLQRRQIPRFGAPTWRRLIVIAILGVLVHSLAITYSQRYITASLASLIGATNPIFTAVFSQTLIGERLTRRKLSGIGLAFVGFLIVLLYGSGRAHFSMDNAIGVAILICSPIGWALYTVLSKPLTGHYEPRIIAGLTTVIGGVLFLPLVAVDPGVVADAARLPALGWLAALTMSVLAIFVGYVVWNRGLRALEATQVAVYMYMTPMFGVLLAWLLLGEHITPWLLLGGATIVAGVVVTNSGRRAVLAPRPRSTPVASAVEP